MMNINSPIRIFLVFAILFPVYSQETFDEFRKKQQQAFEDELSEFQSIR